jgi:hypothetical protein
LVGEYVSVPGSNGALRELKSIGLDNTNKFRAEPNVTIPIATPCHGLETMEVCTAVDNFDKASSVSGDNVFVIVAARTSKLMTPFAVPAAADAPAARSSTLSDEKLETASLMNCCVVVDDDVAAVATGLGIFDIVEVT